MNNSVVMAGFWGRLLELAVNGVVETEIVNQYSQLVEKVWAKLREVVERKLSSTDLEQTLKWSVDTWFEIDKLIIKSYDSEFGSVVRRALIGVLSLQLERTDLACFQRILDGVIEYSTQG